MIGLLGNAYLWVKAGHIIFVIFWMAGLFMLPRFFVYHQEAAPGSEEERRWIDREDRLLRIILKPALIIVWVFGLALALDTGAFAQGWFHLKFLAVLLLSGYHGWMVGYARKLRAGDRSLSGRTLRIVNEVPGIAAAIIVIMAIVKPF
jgi:protoporphyrinogen IX oxidase